MIPTDPYSLQSIHWRGDIENSGRRHQVRGWTMTVKEATAWGCGMVWHMWCLSLVGASEPMLRTVEPDKNIQP